MFFKQEKSVAQDELTVSEFIALDIRLNDIITQWVLNEVGAGIVVNSKLSEIAVLNFKIILQADETGKAMREFICRTVDIKDETDYLFSRIQDLYIYISLSFPKFFLDSVMDKFVTSLTNLHYDVDQAVLSQHQYIWLLPKIQHCLRYIVKK